MAVPGNARLTSSRFSHLSLNVSSGILRILRAESC